MKKTMTLWMTFFAMSVQTHAAEPLDEEVSQKNHTTSWIANDGGWEEVHIPHDMLNMFVHPDGTVATICGWDEGGTNVAVFRDGQLISRPEGSGTGGWGRFSGAQVALDDHYVYQLLTQHGCDGGNNDLNPNGLRQYPPCDDRVEWKTIRRYHRETGFSAPFPGGYGYKGDMLVVASDKSRQMKGLAISDRYLYVAITGNTDSIKIYDKKTLSFHKGYPVTGGLGILAADRKGGLWMMQENRIVRMQADTGRLLAQQIEVPEGVRAISFNIDNQQDRILLPNRGKDMNVLVYDHIFKHPRLQTTWGETGGVFAHNKPYKSGQAGPWRFSGPTGAGVDARGRIYICNTTVSGGRGSVLECYDHPLHPRQLWKQEGLIFTATADFDRSDDSCYYSPEKVHRIYPDREGGRLDELVAYTADPFRFPDDERVKEKDAAFVTSTFKRTIQGRNFLFVSDMYGGFLAGYRFEEETMGYVGIPCLVMNNGDPDKNQPILMWVDANGDGHRQDPEYHPTPEINPYSMSFFVDFEGNVWRGTRGQGVMYWHLKGLDDSDLPQYDEPVRFPLPEGISDAKRVFYDSRNDELILAGFSPEKPDSKDTWWCMGSTIAVCRDFLKNNGHVEPSPLFYIPFHIEDGSGLDHTNAKAMTVEGDYIFVAIAREGLIHIYDRHTGVKVEELRPGENVHGQSGWCDFNYAINARLMPDGSYTILIEENAFGKILVHKWKPAK